MPDKTPNRKRSVHFHFWADEEEATLIRERMASLGVTSLGAYMRKMAIDGYHINLNQIARRANETRSIYEADIEDLRRQYDTLWEAANGILSGLAKIK